VRPYVALGVGLQAAGHDIRIVAHRGFENLVRKRGLDFAPLAGDPRDSPASKDQQLLALRDRGRNLRRLVREFNRVDGPLMRQRLQDCWAACRDADVVVASMLPYLFSYAIAKKLQVPLVRAFYFPVSPTRAYPPDFVPKWLRLGQRLNLTTYHVQRQLLWEIARPWIAGACREVLGIQKLPRREPFGDLDRQQQLLLYGYSAAVAPPPPDWGEWIEVTGYWFLDWSTDWTPPRGLVSFLENGPPPVCIGFGSMTYDRTEVVDTVMRALALTGHRAVLLTGWGALLPPELQRNVFAIDWVPLDWLFSRMAAVVHHGGAGTTAEGLRAGVPTVIVPFFYDQFLWGRRVFELGIGPRPIPRKRLDAHKLAAALRLATTDPAMRRRAAELASRIKSEDGVSRAVTAFERYFSRPSPMARPLPACDRPMPSWKAPGP
jgi:UDP:flavonoid glycosyltransferase YjiC (YdhE family)